MEIVIGGKRKDNEEWVYGAYFYIRHYDDRHTHHLIIPIDADMSLGTPIEKIQVEVDPNTLGMFAYNEGKEPSELLVVERKKVLEYKAEVDYKLTKNCKPEYLKGSYRGQQMALEKLFGDKCLSDKLESYSKPKFKIGDRVIGIKDFAKLYAGIMTISNYKYENSHYIYFTEEFGSIWFKESDLELYTEPETKDNTDEALYEKDMVSSKDEENIEEMDAYDQYREAKEKELNLEEFKIKLAKLLNDYGVTITTHTVSFLTDYPAIIFETKSNEYLSLYNDRFPAPSIGAREVSYLTKLEQKI